MASCHAAAYSLETTCPSARWRKVGADASEFSIEGLRPCAIVVRGKEHSPRWYYRVDCSVTHRHFALWYDTQEKSIEQAEFWLRYVQCPGLAEKPATPPAESASTRRALPL